MRAKIQGKQVNLTKELGRGGEGVAYLHSGKVVKIYHANQQHLLADRMAKIRDFPQNVPSNVARPLEIVYNTQGEEIGFVMPAFNGQDIRFVTKRSWRDGVMSQAETTSLMGNVFSTLRSLHNAGIVFGDFNYTNVLFDGTDCFFIDTDAMQFGKHRCIVGHEQFLDPNLYGVDLAANTVFTPRTDDYSYSVMLFMALLYVHPYGGNHKDYPTLLRRAEAGYSIMHDDIKYPKKAIPYSVLSDELLHYFVGIFDNKKREEFTDKLLASLQWTTCTCGTEHARASCPVCQVAVYKPAVTHHGKCRLETTFETKGSIITAVMQHGLKYVYEENGIIYREDGSRVMTSQRVPNMRFAIAGSSTWIGHARSVVKIRNESVDKRQSTGILGGLPMFDSNATHCYGTEDDHLMDYFRGTRVGNILKDKTWFKVGSTFGFGFYQVGKITQHFVFQVGKTGVKSVDLPDIEGRVLDAEAYFDDNYVLFCLSTEYNGKNRNFMYLLRKDGTLKAKVEGTPDDRILESVKSKAIMGGRLLCSTDDGLISLKTENGKIEEGTVFTETEPFVSADSEIYPSSDGSIYIVSPHRVEKLTMS